ncbi:MAG: WYL domain-containing transcriptional regulator [Verrucomicrobiota bacterium]
MPESTRSRKTSRPPLVRMLRIHEELQNERYPNCNKLARALEVSTKTIQRDFDFMRDQLGLPIDYEQTKFGYYYTEPVSHFPTVQVSEGELVALFVAQKAMAQYQGTAFEKPLQAAFQKLTEGLRDQVSFELGNWESFFSFRSSGSAIADLKLFEKLSQSVMRSCAIRFDYKKLQASDSEMREVNPYHLASIDNQWYLFAYDKSRKDIRTFALPRISNVLLLNETFVIPPDFSISEMLKNSFGVFSGKDMHEVRIHFDAWAAQLIKEKFWHPSQQIKDLPDGTIELTLTLGSLPEIERWVLSWGEHAQVHSPKELRQRVQSVTKIMADYYRK